MDELKKKPGRKPGTPKTGGRQKGSLNKKTVWLRDALNDVDLSWELEFKKALVKKDFALMGVLINLLPYLSPKIKEKESQEEPAAQPEQDTPTAELLSLIKK
jgi:hypothetical protein